MNSISRFIWICLPTVIIITTAVYVPYKLQDENGFKRVEQLTQDIQRLKSQNRQIRRENQALKSQIKAIHSDPDFIENIARHEMGMIAPDEVVYQF